MKRILLSSIATALVAIQAHAQVFVSTTGNNTTGDSWANALTSVSAGAAAADTQNEDLWIAGGTYAIAAQIAVGANVRVYGGFPTTGNPGFVDRDTDVFPTILDANSSGPIFQASGVSGVVIDGIEFTEAAGSSGGAIRVVSAANIDINDCRFFNNTVTTFGAGVYIDGLAHADITRSEFDSNTAPEAAALMLFQGTAAVSDCVFSNNDGGGQGGAILAYEQPITIERCVFDTNEANRGGAVAVREGTGGSITNTLFLDNVANDHGAGVNLESQLSFSIVNCTFVDNTAATRGGGVFFHSSSGVVANNIFVNNNQRAIYENDASADPVVRNNMFLSNPNGVYYDESTTSLATANDLNALAEATGNLDDDPEFVDAGNDDYHIQTDSPARNAGSLLNAPSVDFDSEFRDASPDIGFDESEPGLPLASAMWVALAVILAGVVLLNRHRASA